MNCLVKSMIFLGLFGFVLSAAAAKTLPLDKIELPKGFHIEVFAEVPGARSLAYGDGTVFVGTRNDKVFAIREGKVYQLASGLDQPNGVAYKDGSLYVAEIAKISRLDHMDKLENLQKPPKPIQLESTFPSDRHHGWKFIAIGPDHKLYVPVGAPCNVCDKGDKYAAIFKQDLDGKNRTLVAKGIRNTVGFSWHPETKSLYFTDNGRDMLGDDIPSDELNHAPKNGLDFGFPRCHAGDIPDPEFGKKGDACKGVEKPIAKLGAHVAALGMRFYTGKTFPAEYKNRIFIAEHGSWNRSKPVGYQVVTVQLDPNGKTTIRPFATGWLQNDKAWGRPVDVLEMPDGSLLVSDDTAEVVYRISFKA